jgi:type IV pilus assembly protein PilB
MDEALELELLEKYAQASNDVVLSSQADLDPKDRAMPEMLQWCRQQGNVVVLASGNILTSHPSDRRVHNCKIVMLNHGLTPKRVRAATNQLINILLINAQEGPDANNQQAQLAPVVSAQQQRLRMLVRAAMDAEASDIHLEVRDDIARIRFRRHGELFLHAEWLPHLAREMAAVAFNHETDHAATHFNPLVPQNASMPLQVEGESVRLRLASLPAHGGFDMVMRILALGNQKIHSLHTLGYPAGQVHMMAKITSLPSGAVILAGPTGSGKTTTLASCMQMVQAGRKIYTIEDPIEKLVSTATQVPIHTEHFDRGFANMGRSVLRMDPDVMVLGEIRDDDTAKVMVRAALTGHLVFSTLHTNTAMGIVPRLLDMGLSAHLICDPNFLQALVCQRLVPKLCPECAKPARDSQRHQPHLFAWQQLFGQQVAALQARSERGCKACHGTGISGQSVVAEIIVLDAAARQFIAQQDFAGWERHLRSVGWESYRDKAKKLVANGLVDPLDAQKVVGELVVSHHQPVDFQYHEYN